jgi:hypothetical protein
LNLAAPSTTTRKNEETTERKEKKEREEAEASLRSGEIFSQKFKKKKERKEVKRRQFGEVPPSKNYRTSSRSSRKAQPQVYPSLDRFPFVTTTERCLALKQKDGFLFSKEELNYWLKCPHSTSYQESHQLRKEHNFLGHYKLAMPEEKYLTAGKYSFKKPGWLDSEDMASHTTWAGRPTQIGQGVPQKLGKASHRNCPTVNGHCVPEKQGMMSQFGVQKISPNLGTVWSGPSFPTGSQSVWEDRLGQPWTGSMTPTNGRSIHGMSPSWATFSFSAKAKPQMKCLQGNIQEGPSAPFFTRLRQRLPWWRTNTQDPSVLHLIRHGVTATFPLPNSLSMHPCFRNQEETNLAWETIQEYLDVGAIKEIPLQQAKHLIPWFVIKKGRKAPTDYKLQGAQQLPGA